MLKSGDILNELVGCGQIRDYKKILYVLWSKSDHTSDFEFRYLFNSFTEFPLYRARPSSINFEKTACYELITKSLAPSGVDSEYLLTHVAHMFQEPDKPPAIIISLAGKPGSGKCVFQQLLTALFPHSVLSYRDFATFQDKFNEEQKTALYLILE